MSEISQEQALAVLKKAEEKGTLKSRPLRWNWNILSARKSDLKWKERLQNA